MFVFNEGHCGNQNVAVIAAYNVSDISFLLNTGIHL